MTDTYIPVTIETVSVSFTIPDNIRYSVNDAVGNGPFEVPGVTKGVITDAVIVTSQDAPTPLQGEVWVFDGSVMGSPNNQPHFVSDTDIKKLVGVIPFSMVDAGNNGAAWVRNLEMAFSAPLRFLVRARNTYTPVANEVVTVRLKIMKFA